jgi:hypothetical protein
VNEKLIDVLQSETQDIEDPVSKDPFKRFKSSVANVLRCFSANNDLVYSNMASLANDMTNPVLTKLVEQVAESITDILEAKLKPGVINTIHPWTFIDAVRQRIKGNNSFIIILIVNTNLQYYSGSQYKEEGATCE